MNLEHLSQATLQEFEMKARNIVYQIGDILEAPVEKRQATNDQAIDFVKGFLVDAFSAGLSHIAAESKKERQAHENCAGNTDEIIGFHAGLIWLEKTIGSLIQQELEKVEKERFIDESCACWPNLQGKAAYVHIKGCPKDPS